MQYILTVFDMLSMYAWLAANESKQAASVYSAIRCILYDAARSRKRRFHTDKCKEFFNSTSKAHTKFQHIQLFSTKSNQNAEVAESLNSTIAASIFIH